MRENIICYLFFIGNIPTKLTNRDLRQRWESEFDRKFIQPILNSLQTTVQDQMDLILEEEKKSGELVR